MQYFTTRETATISGLSTHMIHYLCRHGLIRPQQPGGRRRGVRRQFVFRDLVLLRVYRDLLDRGISVKRLKESIKNLQRTKNWENKAKYLCTDGTGVFIHRQEEIEDLILQGQYVFQFVVNIEDVRRELINKIEFFAKAA